MCQVKLITVYNDSKRFEEQVNLFISNYDYNNLEFKYQVSTGANLTYSVLIIIKDYR